MRGRVGMGLLAGAMAVLLSLLLVGGAPASVPTVACNEAALQQAISAGGTYNVPCNDLQLTNPLVMTAGRVTIEGGPTLTTNLQGRIFEVRGGNLTLDGVTLLQGGAGAVGGSNGSNGTSQSQPGADGSPGSGAGAAGGHGGPGAAGGGGTAATPAHVDADNPGSGAERGGCMTIASGATVSIYGGAVENCEVFGSSVALSGGGAQGGDGGSASGGGNGGAGGSPTGANTGPGGKGGGAGDGGAGGAGGAGASGLSVQGGGIYNQGTLSIVGTLFTDNRALGGAGGSGGNGGAGGNGGNGGGGGDGAGGASGDVGGNGGDGGNGGAGGAGGAGGDGGDAFGGAIYNQGGKLLVSDTEFDRNSVQPGFPGDTGTQSSAGEAGAGGSLGGGGTGTTMGSNGASGSGAPPADGGNAGAGGSAAGGAIYSTNAVVLSGDTFGASGANTLGPCECSTYTMQNTLFSGNPGMPGTLGHEQDPDVFGGEVCTGVTAADRAPRLRAGAAIPAGDKVTPACHLFAASVAQRVEWDFYTYRLFYKLARTLRVPSIKIQIPGFTFGKVPLQHAIDTGEGAYPELYECAAGTDLVCNAPTGNHSGWIYFELTPTGLAQRPTTAIITTRYGRLTIGVQLNNFSSERETFKGLAKRDEDKELDRAGLICGLLRTYAGPFLEGMLGGNCEDADHGAWVHKVLQLDPPDHNYHAIALPRPLQAPPSSAGRCPRSSARACRAIASAGDRYGQARLALDSILSAATTAINRGNTARAAGDQSGVDIQAAALAALGGEERAQAQVVEDDGIALGQLIGRHHADVQLTAKQITAEAGRIAGGQLPSSVMQQLAAWGISRQEFTSVMKQALPGFRGSVLKLSGVLRAAVALLPVQAVDGDIIGLLSEGLENAGAISAEQKTRIDADLQALDADPGTAALGRLKRDAARLPREAAAMFAGAVAQTQAEAP